MRRQLGVSCVLALTTLLGGCRTEYLVESRVLEEGLQARHRLETARQDETVAVQVRPVVPDAVETPRYAYLTALRIDKRRADAPWRVSARDRWGLLTGGGVLLGIGVVSIVSGVLGLRLHTSCTACSSDARSASDVFSEVIAGSAIAGGVLEIIPGAILLGIGAPRVETPAGVRGVVYVTETPTDFMGRNTH